VRAKLQINSNYVCIQFDLEFLFYRLLSLLLETRALFIFW
jgi:hypothetical protein